MENVFVCRTVDLILGIVLIGVIVLGIVQERRIEQLERKMNQLKNK